MKFKARTRQMVECDGDEQETLRDCPHDSPPLNVVHGDVPREVHLVYDQQRKDIVRGGL